MDTQLAELKNRFLFPLERNEMFNCGIHGILFDLDGVLVNVSEWHREAFNLTLQQFLYSPIKYKDNIENFNGLSTYKKLDLLIKRGYNAFLDEELRERFYNVKQSLTHHIINEKCKPIQRVIDTVDYAAQLFDNKIAVVTNCNRASAELILTKSNLIDKFDVIVTREDVDGKIKPHPWPYIKAKTELGFANRTKQMLAIDDTDKGILSAVNAQCRTWRLDKFEDLSIESLKKVLNYYKITI